MIMKLIDKDTLAAEIERLISNGQTKLKESEECNDYESYVAWAERIATCINVLSLLDTLEVKEVDEVKIGETQIYLKDDGGEPPYEGKQWLDLSCMEYEIPQTLFKDGDNVEIFIRKAQKGE